MVSKEAISLVAVWLHRRKQCHWVICLSGNPKAICYCTTDTTHNTQIMYQFFCSQVLRDHLQWWNDFSNLQELPLLHQKEHNLLLLDASLRVGMHNYGIKQPVVCCIMRGQDSTLTGLLPLESFGGLIRILNLLISPDISSVVSYLNR